MKSLCSVVLMLVLFGTLCAAAQAQEDVSAPETRRDDLDKFDLVWPEEPSEEPEIDQLIHAGQLPEGGQPAFARAIRTWGFGSRDGGFTWEGRVAGPDRLCFLGVLSRYAALLAHIRLDEAKHGAGLGALDYG